MTEIGSKEIELEELLAEANDLRINNLDQSIQIALSVLEQSEIKELAQTKARALSLLGLFLMIKGDYEKSREYSNVALAYFESISDKKGMADATFNIASTYYKTDNYYFGLQLMLKCRQLYSEISDHKSSAKVLKSIGTIYDYFGDSERAIETYTKCVMKAILANERNIESNAYNPLSSIYLKRGEIEKAMALSIKSIDIKTQTKDYRGLAFSIYGRGKVFLKMGLLDEAIADFEESLSMQQKVGDRLGEGMVLNKLGVAFFQKSDYDNAIHYLNRALYVGQKFNINLITYKANHTFYLLYKNMGQWEKSLMYLEAYNQAKELTQYSQTNEIISSYEALFKLEKLEQEAQLQEERYKIIENKNFELDSFFYKVSHDLKGPIASLMGLERIIEYDKMNPEAVGYFKLFKSQFERLNMIVMDLIDLTKMQRIEENATLIDFDKMVRECVQSYAYHEKFDQIKFQYDIDPDLEYSSQWVIINTIFQNLIENAIKYSKAGVSNLVKIEVKKEKGNVRISVTDSGIGISEEHQAHIFRIFFRANSQMEGTGLGLYILKRAVERLNGKVSLNSEFDKGSTFTIHLPMNLPLAKSA